MKRVFTLIAVTSLFLAGTFIDASTSKGSKGSGAKGSGGPDIKATQINKNVKIDNKIVDKSKDININNNKIVDKSKDINIIDKSKDTKIVINAPGTTKGASPTSYFGGKAPTAFSVKTPAKYHAFCHHHCYTGWSSHCWFGQYRCYGHYCPVACGYYYWYAPFQCYLPVSYITVYVPTVVVVQPVVVPAPVTVTVALPMGATALPATFVPALPGTLIR